MKAKTLSAAVALVGLVASAGTAIADIGHDAYNHAFFGAAPGTSSETMGKAAYGTPSDANIWSGQEAYNRAIFGTPAAKPQADTMGKAAYGSESWGSDGNITYHSAFRGD